MYVSERRTCRRQNFLSRSQVFGAKVVCHASNQFRVIEIYCNVFHSLNVGDGNVTNFNCFFLIFFTSLGLTLLTLYEKRETIEQKLETISTER